MKYLKLIRIPNLLLIATIMYAMRDMLIRPILERYGYEISSSESAFGLMVLSVLFITAAAGIINDYFDRKADFINQPETVLIGNKINRRIAIVLHTIFNIIGVALGFVVSFMANQILYGLVSLVIATMFYLYSAIYKKRLIIGNIIISLLIAGIPLLPWLTEYMFAKIHYTAHFPTKIYHHLFILSLGFSIAGFLFNLSKEMVKDLITLQGDLESGNKTIPIVFGEKTAKNVLSILFSANFIFILLAWFLYLRHINSMQYPVASFGYLIVFLIIPLIVLSTYIPRVNQQKTLKNIVRLINFMILFGGIFIVIIYLNIRG